MTIIEFIRARLDEEGSAARAEADLQERVFPANEFTIHYEWSRQTHHHSGGSGTSLAPGAPSPSQVIRDIEAKRALLTFCEDDPFCHDGGWAYTGRVLELLALPYSDHPDYRQEWAP